MLDRGFSLFEMLLVLLMTSLILMSIVTFYPQFLSMTLRTYQQYKLEETLHQGIARLIKDLKRAGFIANDPELLTQSAISIRSSGQCIIIRYDRVSRGKWQINSNKEGMHDIFAYRWKQNNLEYQGGIDDCTGSLTRWERLFDPNEISVEAFSVKQYDHYTQLYIMASLKQFPTLIYQATYYIKNENN